MSTILYSKIFVVDRCFSQESTSVFEFLPFSMYNSSIIRALFISFRALVPRGYMLIAIQHPLRDYQSTQMLVRTLL